MAKYWYKKALAQQPGHLKMLILAAGYDSSWRTLWTARCFWQHLDTAPIWLIWVNYIICWETVIHLNLSTTLFDPAQVHSSAKALSKAPPNGGCGYEQEKAVSTATVGGPTEESFHNISLLVMPHVWLCDLAICGTQMYRDRFAIGPPPSHLLLACEMCQLTDIVDRWQSGPKPLVFEKGMCLLHALILGSWGHIWWLGCTVSGTALTKHVWWAIGQLLWMMST